MFSAPTHSTPSAPPHTAAVPPRFVNPLQVDPGDGFAPAGLLRRAAAFALDFVIWWCASWIASLPVLFAMAATSGGDGTVQVQAIELLVSGAISAALAAGYFVWLPARHASGATFGKRAFGIRVVRPDGTQASREVLVRRTLATFGPWFACELLLGVLALAGADGLAAVVVVVAGLLAMTWWTVDIALPPTSLLRQSLHDRVADTVVVRDLGIQPPPTGAVQPRPRGASAVLWPLLQAIPMVIVIGAVIAVALGAS